MKAVVYEGPRLGEYAEERQAVDDSTTDPVQAVLDQTTGLGADNGCKVVLHPAAGGGA